MKRQNTGDRHSGIPRQGVAQVRLPDWEALPDIGLYMDQVITLMERTFGGALPKGEITKSMVNNYVKVELIPRPIGKKYDREHLALLLVIGVLKQALSMESIARVLRPLCEGGVREGYTRFAEEFGALNGALESGRVELTLEGSTPGERALHAAVMAAVCTIAANGLLGEKQENPGAAGA